MMRPVPITRIGDSAALRRDAHSDELRAYVEQQFQERYASRYPDLLMDCVVSRRSDYDEIKVFLTRQDLVADAEAFARELEDTLAAQGIGTFIYVRTWSGPWRGGQP